MPLRKSADVKTVAARTEAALVKLLHGRATVPRFEQAIERLARRQGAEIYVHLFFLAAHLSLNAKTAAAWWTRTLAHMRRLRTCLRRPVDFRTALLDLLTSEKSELRGPKIIELKIYQETAKASITDELTRLHNRRHFGKVLDTEVKRALRYRTPLTLLMFDLDDFKKFNDRYGHLAGDMALKRFGRVLTGALRDVDIVSRIGGEEFAALLPQTDIYGAQISAERVRTSATRAVGPLLQRKRLPAITVSVGIAALGPKAGKPNHLMYSADMALYQSKAAGKNTVSTSPS